MQNGFILGWRIGFIAIIVNMLLSMGVAFLPIDSLQISSFTVTASYTVFALCLMLFVSRKNLAEDIPSLGFRGFDVTFLPLIILFPLSAQFFCTMLTMPISVITSFLAGLETKEDIITPHTVKDLMLSFSYLCILAPVSEEIIFRGVIYKYFNRHSSFTAIFASAVVFALAHLDMRSFIPIFFIGLTLSLVRFSTGSIWATMISHSAVNMPSLALMLTKTDTVYTLVVCVMALTFPVSAILFIRNSHFPKLTVSLDKTKVSVCMILTIVLFALMQVFMIVTNIIDMIEENSSPFNYYFENEYNDDFEYSYPDFFESPDFYNERSFN